MLNNISIQRVDLSKCFSKWKSNVRAMRNFLQKSEQRQFLRIIQKLEKIKVARKFMYWKYLLKFTVDKYSFQNEMMDTSVIKALGDISKGLCNDLSSKKITYKSLIKKKCLTKLMMTLKDINPTRTAFK